MIGLFLFWKRAMLSSFLDKVRIDYRLNLRFAPDINCRLNGHTRLRYRRSYIPFNFICRCQSFDQGFIRISFEISLLLLASTLVAFFWSIRPTLVTMVIWYRCLVLCWSTVTGLYCYYFLRLSGCWRFFLLGKASVLLVCYFVSELNYRAG